MRLKAVQLAVMDALPEEYQPHVGKLDVRGLSKLLHRVAVKDPDKYAEVSHKISTLGRNAAYWQGETLGLDDFEDPIDTKSYLAAMDKEVKEATKGIRDKDKVRETREAIWGKWAARLEGDAMKAGLAKNNAVALSVASGARGKPLQLRAMLSTPALFEDYRGRIVPLFARRSYAQGVSPGEFLAGTFGARTSVTATKVGTAKGGYLGKLLAQVAAPLVVTEQDCGTTNGIDIPTDDDDIRNRFLARDQAGLSAGGLLDRKSTAQLINSKEKTVLVRSPMTCQAKQGLCSKCIGADPRGELYPIGYAAGITASNALSEPLTQMALNTKHCLLEGTEVLLVDGRVLAVEDVRAGDMVFGYSEDGSRTPVRVLACVNQGVQVVRKYAFRPPLMRKYRIDVTATEDHQVLTPEGKQPVGAASELLIPCANAAYGTDYPFAFLAGFFMGDGIRWDAKAVPTVTVSCAEPETVKHLQAYLAPYNITMKKRKRGHDWALVFIDEPVGPRDAKTGRMVGGNLLNPVKIMLRDLGWEGKYAHEKTIPPQVWGWDKQSVAAFVAGFLTADGSIYPATSAGKLGVAFASCCKRMIEDLQRLLLFRLGVSSTGITNTIKATSKRRAMWQFTVGQPDMLAALVRSVGFTPAGPKRTKAATLYAQTAHISTPSAYVAKLAEVSEAFHAQCYDLTVDSENELFALANGAVVKNTSGASTLKKTYSGLDWLGKFAQIPDDFPDRAPIAEQAGAVGITQAPQGGHIVRVGNKDHYVPAHLALKVKDGDDLEAGDALSEGVVRPDDVVRVAGLGQGRRYWADRFRQMLADSGTPASRRNTEVMARATVNHLRVLDPDGSEEFLPDDVAPADMLLRDYTPPEDAKYVEPDAALGSYLQAPALHYTIGTKVTPRVAKHLQDVKFGKIEVHDKAPNFAPEMPRLMTATAAQPDWMASLNTNYLRRQLSDRAARGQDTNFKSNIHFAPRLAAGVGFGENLETKGTY